MIHHNTLSVVFLRTVTRILLAAFGCMGILAVAGVAQEQNAERLFEQEPFDRLTLDAENDNAVLKLLPLDLPGRLVPDNPRLEEKLTIRLVQQPNREYEVEWLHIEKLELFEQMVLAEARQLTAEEKFDEAYDYYAFLRKKYPDMPHLDQATEDYVFHNAGASYKAGRLDEALAWLEEVYRLNPQRPGLQRTMAGVIGQLIETHVSRENYDMARAQLTRASRYKWQTAPAILGQWQEKLTNQASQQLEAARQHLAAGRLPEASRAARRMLTIWPAIQGGRDLVAQVARQYPLIVVGVTHPSVARMPAGLDDWASRRTGRLLHRQLVELAGFGPEGARYASPLGKITRDEDGQSIWLQLSPRPSRHDTPQPSGYGIALGLLAMADGHSDLFSPAWAQLVTGVSVNDVYRVHVEFNRPHVRPEALLQTVFATEELTGAANRVYRGPYTIAARKDDEVHFVSQEHYPLAVSTQPKELIEQSFDDTHAALRALRSGRIDVVDRILPAFVQQVSEDPSLVVQSYDVPSIHVLVPNRNKTYPANHTFRRAVLYGINREAILQWELLRGKKLTGCQLISGPVAVGRGPDDPLAYGYDSQLARRSYEPGLALTLARVADAEIAKQAKRAGGQPPERPKLVLGHPPGEIPKIACQAIARQLLTVGIECSPRELPADATLEQLEQCHFVYVEMTMSEPLVDVRRILTSGLLAQNPSPYLEQALRRLDRATNWTQVRKQLREIHHTAYHQMTVIPLWQLIDHFVYHRRLRGVGKRPVLLYQDIEQWQMTPHLPGK